MPVLTPGQHLPACPHSSLPDGLRPGSSPHAPHHQKLPLGQQHLSGNFDSGPFCSPGGASMSEIYMQRHEGDGSFRRDLLVIAELPWGNGLAQLRVLPECCPFRRHPVSASGGRLCNRMCGILGRRNDVNTARNALARESGAKAPAAARARPLLAGRNPRLPGRGRHQCSENSCTQLKNRSGRARPVDPPPHSP